MLRTWLHDQQLLGYLQVLATDPWANLKAALGTINVEEIALDAICAYMDLLAGGIKEVETLDHARISAYYGEYSTTEKV